MTETRHYSARAAAVLLTAWLGNLLFGAPAGFVAAVLLAASVLLGVEARMAKIDAVLLAVILTARRRWRGSILRMQRARGAAALGRAAVAGIGRRADAERSDHPAGRVGTVLLLTIAERNAAWLRQLRADSVPLMLLVCCRGSSRSRSRATAHSEIAVGKSLLGKVATGQQAHGAPPGYIWPPSR